MAGAKNSKIDLPVQSVLAILLVTFLTPLIAGGSIALAADYAGEDRLVFSPDDVNGFGWVAGTQGNCVTTTGAGVPTTTTTISSSPIVTQGLHDFTTLGAGYLNGTSGNTLCEGANQFASFKIQLPNNIFTRNESHSRFMFEYYANSGCTSACSNDSYDLGWDFDWSVHVNGTRVFGQNDFHVDGYTWLFGTNIRSHWKMNYSLNVVDYNNLHTEMGDCQNDCSYVLHYDHLVKGTDSTTADYSKAPHETTGLYRVSTYALDDFSASMVMKVTPVVLGVFFGLVALASTSLWNPVFKTVKSKLRKTGGLY